MARNDSFDRADSTTSLGTPSDGGSAWIAQAGTWGISSNKAYKVATDALLESAAIDYGSSNQVVQATFSVTGNSGLIFRSVGHLDHLLFQISGGNTQKVWKRVSGTYTQLGSTVTQSVANGDVFKVQVTAANEITTYQNGVTRHTITDSTHSTATRAGILIYDVACRFDDFSITDPGAAVASLIYYHPAIAPLLVR